MAGTSAKRGASWLFGAALVATIFAALRGAEMDASAGTQQCNTECQSKMTDCILACDGMRSCEEACKKKGQSCVNVCTSDAGPESPHLLDGAVDAPPMSEISDARSNAAKDGARRATARDR